MLERLATWIPGQWEKVILTAVLIGMALLAAQLWARFLSSEDMAAEKRRIHLVWARNLIWLAALLLIISIWASTIAGFALSLAAVAGALLIVSKELLMCVHGYLYLSLVQPYKIGDVIEFNHMRGRVVDIDMFATTLVELDAAGQRTGRLAAFPNGQLLTQSVLNASPSGRYELHTIRLPIPEALAHQLDRIETAAWAAADQATAAWQEEAIAHFRKLSAENFIDLPSGKTKLSWDFSNPEHLFLSIRIACPTGLSASVEQTVFRDTWRALAPPGPAAVPEP
ncbi:mechanosensitive ion channel family protein [Paucibacter sp. Y2R2-4]|uniref:mechanosensitive ion channel family protein n=1 Tax=Paucibacter sp. Y2R2-4 TaxID=2893553 RepID=UPI0021E3D756|nr:mechanosensitive ion channel family protein [Paucibacter sp. Y2R2-4]MCV2349611.1 mechanosensitive ion channel family protein [Paucibacter sp. Y2R2-4]